jgi:hypothetical protein
VAVEGGGGGGGTAMPAKSEEVAGWLVVSFLGMLNSFLAGGWDGRDSCFCLTSRERSSAFLARVNNRLVISLMMNNNETLVLLIRAVNF